MADVFISYQRQDRAFCEVIADALKRRSFSVWWDNELHPRENWDKLIEREIASAKAVVVLWTPIAVESDWVREEARYAKDRGKLVPVKMVSCSAPLGFGGVQTQSLEGWLGDDNDRRWLKVVSWIEPLAGARVPTQSMTALSEVTVVPVVPWNDLAKLAKRVPLPEAHLAPRGRTSKYRRLFDHLVGARSALPLTMSFDEIETVLQTRLPASAKRDRSWWANTSHGSHVQAQAWLDAGALVESVDFAHGAVVFGYHHGDELGADSSDATLQIILGRGGDFESFRNHEIYTNRHTFKVAIKNTSARAFASNCKLHLEIAKPDEAAQSFLLVDTFTLNAGEDLFVPIVAYDEAIAPHPKGGPNLNFLVPVGQGYNVGHGWPWQVPVGSYSFALKLTAKGHPATSKILKAFVDAEGVLKLELAETVSPSQTGEYMSWADLVRHVVASKWGASFDPQNDDQVLEMLENIRDQFNLLVIEAQGRREGADGRVGAMEYIETKGFWDGALWHFGRGIPLADQRLPSSVWRNREIYRDVRVKRDDVARVWDERLAL